MARRLFLHLYLMRVPILMLLMLGVLLPCALSSPLLHAMADLEPNQVWLVAFAATLLLSTAITCCFLVLLYGGERADGQRKPPAPDDQLAATPDRLPPARWIVALLYVGGSALYLSFLYRVEQTMADAHLDTRGLASAFWLKAGLGTLLASLFILLIFVLDLWISDPRSKPQIEVFALPIAYIFNKVGWISSSVQFLNDQRPLRAVGLERLLARDNWLNLWLVRILGPGYGRFDGHGNPVEIYPGHRFAGFLFALSIGVYVFVGRGVYRQLANDAAFPPPAARDAVMLHVILLLLLTCWGLSAFCFFFDRFRVPALIPIALVVTLTSQLGPSDHSFRTIDRSPDSTLPKPQDLLADKKDRAILVAAAGGGIQAAAWTSQVLCGLQAEKESPLAGNVLAISGVSGGSVGAMFYLRCLENQNGTMDVVKASKESSLEAIAWGLAYPDLRRALLPVKAFVWPGADRGWALERAFRKNAQFPDPMNRPLTSRDLQKDWPTVLFNSTEVHTGDPIVFSNSDFPEPSPATDRNHALHGFHQVYAPQDVLLETAVRMSAAFPFVSPAAQPDVTGNTEHFADGGYFDNSGLFTLTRWLKTALPNPPAADSKEADHTPKQKILILIIDAFPDREWKGPTDTTHAWPYQLRAPVDTVLGVRSEGAAVRDLSDTSAVLQILSLRGYDAEALTVRYVPPAQVDGKPGPKNCPQEPPLTWRLTQVEQKCIDQQWSVIEPQVVSQMKDFFNGATRKEEGSRGQTQTRSMGNGLYVQWIAR